MSHPTQSSSDSHPQLAKPVTQETAASSPGNPSLSVKQEVSQQFSQMWASVAERGRPPVLSSQEEAQLVEVFKSNVSKGRLFSRIEVLQIASDFATKIGKRDRAKSFSVQWYYNFLRRWPEVKAFFQ